MNKLDAVNMVLNAIGEEPVSSLNSGLPEAEAAESALDRAVPGVLAKGWHVNTDYEFKLLPDANTKRIAVPSNVLRIDASSRMGGLDITTREVDGQLCLYDKREKTYEFDRPVYCDIVWELPFESLPYELAYYIVIKAAQAFQRSEMSSAALDGFLAEEELEAYAALIDWETEQDDTNMLTHTYHGAAISGRRHRARFL